MHAGVFDVPNERSSHDAPVLRGGGIAQTAGIMVALLVAILMAGAMDRPLLVAVAIASIASAALGWAEDSRGVKIAARAGLQFAIGAGVLVVTAVYLGYSPWWGALGGVALICLINVVNFMDGVNEISAFHGVIAGGSFVVIGYLNGVSWMVISGAILAAAFVAFVPWNFNGAIFLGDVGSYLLGGIVGIVIILGWMEGVSVYVLASPMAIYVADTGVTLTERILAREKWYEAHRDHTYQRLIRRGLSHVSVASLVAGASLLSTAAAVGASESSGSARYWLTVLLIAIVASYIALRYLKAPNRRASQIG